MTAPQAKMNWLTHQQFRTDTEYLNSHWHELRDTYPNCYVAVCQEQVVASHADLQKVLKELEERDVPTNSVALRYIAEPPLRMIL